MLTSGCFSLDFVVTVIENVITRCCPDLRLTEHTQKKKRENNYNIEMRSHLHVSMYVIIVSVKWPISFIRFADF